MFEKYEIFNVSEMIDVLLPLGSEGPMVRFLLRNGHSVEGLILKSQKGFVMIQTGSDLAYINQDTIMSLIVIKAGQYPKILSQGAIARNPGESYPSRLELKRQLRTQSSEMDWSSVKGLDEDTVNLHIQELMQALVKAQSEIAIDQLGKLALKEISEVKIIHNQKETLKISKLKKMLIIETDLSKQHPKDLQKKLQTKISSIL